MRRRASWDETWMMVACTIAQRSACVLAQVGSVIVDSTNRIVATGYNGPASKMASERWLGQYATCQEDCPRGRGDVERDKSYGSACISIHSEANALLFCDRRDREGGTIYSSAVACPDCQKLVANSGLARVVMIDDERPNRPYAEAMRFYRRSGLEVIRFASPMAASS